MSSERERLLASELYDASDGERVPLGPGVHVVAAGNPCRPLRELEAVV